MLVYCKCCGKYYEIKYPVGKKPVKSKWPQSIKLHRTIFSSQKIYASPFKIYFILHASLKKKSFNGKNTLFTVHVCTKIFKG